MVKLSFMVVLVLSAFLCIINENEAGFTEGKDESQSSKHDYKPFTVVTKTPVKHSESEILPLSSAYKLPSEFIKEGKEWHLASGSYNFRVSLCPELRMMEEKATALLEILRRMLPGSNKCLFVKEYEYFCDRVPELSLDIREDRNGSEVVCGLHNHQKLVDAQYYNCGSEKHLAKYVNEIAQANKNRSPPPPFKPLLHRIYEICFDFHHKKTLWTRHSPMTVALLTHPESPYSQLSNEFSLEDFKVDTSSLNIHGTTFHDLKKSYESTNPKATRAFTMVPKDHMALFYWKTATTHMINAAPLLPEFADLMNAINNGIFRASSNIFAKTKKTLQIYTRADTYLHSIFESVAAFFTSEKPDLFKPNIWYQFVYNEDEKSGVLIVLHNTREQLPEQKECKGDELLTCNFRNWSSSPALILDNSKSLDHAYCCNLPVERIKNIFSLKALVLEKVFNIEDVINETLIETVGNHGTNAADNENKLNQ